jgi:hypothetical protein
LWERYKENIPDTIPGCIPECQYLQDQRMLFSLMDQGLSSR